MASDTDHASRRTCRRPLVLYVLAFVLLALLVAGGWLLGSESGARAALSMLSAASDGAVQMEGIHGRLVGPLRIDRVAVERPDQKIALDNVRLDWEPLALVNAQLHITSLHIEKASIASKMEQTPEPAKMPDSISLPLALQLDAVQVDAADIGWGPVNLIKLSAFAFDLDFDGKRYRLQLNQLGAHVTSGAESIGANVSGQLTLDTAKPYALHAEFASAASALVQNQAIGANGRIKLDGSLAEFATQIDLSIKQARVQGQALLRPFSTPALASANVVANAVDLAALRPDLPHTELDGSLSATANGAGRLMLTNRDAGLHSEGKLPLTALQLMFRQAGDALLFERIAATFGTGKQPAGNITGSGRYANGALALAARIDALDLHRIDQRLQATRLSGKIDLQHAAGKQQLSIDLIEPVGNRNAALTARATLSDARLAVEHAALRLGSGRLDANGHVDFSNQQTFSAEGQWSRFRLQDIGQFAQFPALDSSGKFSLHGARLPHLSADLAFHIHDSRIAGQTLQGNGQAKLRADRILIPKLSLSAGDNRLEVHGELSGGDAQLSFALAAPKLTQLGPGFGGSLQASGNARGTFKRPHLSATWSGVDVRLPGQLQADSMQGKAELAIDRNKPFLVTSVLADVSGRGWKTASQQLAALSAHLQFAPQANAPMALDIHAEGLVMAQLKAERFSATVRGSTAQHTIDATLTEPGQSQSWTLNAGGGLQQLDRAPRWQGNIQRFDASGRFVAHLASPATLLVSAQRTQLDQFRLDANNAQFTVEQFVRDAKGIATRGRVDRLQLAQVLKFATAQPALTTDLELNGAWDIRLADTIEGNVSLRRQSGDVVMRGGTPVALGLRDLAASATAANGRVQLRINAEGQQLGRINMTASTVAVKGANRPGWSLNTPLSGTASIDIPSLAWAGPLMSPTAVTEGRVQSEITLSGSMAQPQFSGRIAASGLRLLHGDFGLDLRNGVLDSEFRGDTLLVKTLAFQSNGGSLTASGPISVSGGQPNAQIALQAERFMLLNRSDRKLVISGQSRIAWREKRIDVTGAFDVNSGFFDIGRQDMPQLSDDVVIVGRTKKSAGAMMAAVDVSINLANGVALKGRGLDGSLAGQLHLTSAPNELLRAQGSVQIVRGTYTAYGRKLAIEQGALRFNGPLHNPALDIVAMQRDQEVAAGVAVRGTVLAPRVTLVSEPPLPEAEKLSWLVLGRALDTTTGSADLGTLQSAAGALLSESAASGVQSQIASAFGLDDFRIATDQDNLQQRIVTLGKRLSSRLYVSYEQSLQATTSVLLLRYTLSPRLTVEAEAGTRSALSLLYNVAFD